MNYEQLSILNTHLLNDKYNDVYQEIIKNNEINENLSLIFIAYRQQGFSKEEIFVFIKEEITKQVSENFLIKKQTQKMMEEINKFDFENEPSTSTGIYHLPSFTIQVKI